MANRVSLTMSVEMFNLIHGFIVAQGAQVVPKAALLQQSDMVPDSFKERMLREVECLNSYLTDTPKGLAPIKASPAEVFEIVVRQPEDNAEYQANKVAVGNEVRAEFGLPPRATQ